MLFLLSERQCVPGQQKYRLYLKRVSGVHPSSSSRGKGGKNGSVGGADASFQAMMGQHGMPMPLAGAMQPSMMAPGMAHLAGSAAPPRELMHQMQLQQVSPTTTIFFQCISFRQHCHLSVLHKPGAAAAFCGLWRHTGLAEFT